MNINLDTKVLLRNFTASAPWASRFYFLDGNSGEWEGISTPTSQACISGYASTLITCSDGVYIKKLFAIYLRNDLWMIFDGEREIQLLRSAAQWMPRNFGRASLFLKSSSNSNTITYWKPWLRHWFEDGWSLNDIDIAHLICRGINDKAVLVRLEEALKIANSKGNTSHRSPGL